jgi:imidazolonepropionase-like amidohydrolase/Tol biopolymer transport system component
MPALPRHLGPLLLLLAACRPTNSTEPGEFYEAVLEDTGKPGEPEKEPEAKDEEEKWDVDAPKGPMDEVAIDVTTGTWMSLDVSPDGKEIVFDLLGDLYTLPFGGGEAKALTSGISWDMQPNYSPDGKLIAFTSDRGGGDNIWVVNRDGTEPKEVSKEDFRLLNSPAWSPDGQFIVARKHFTATRSLGSGELWLYHRTGGKGLQMTEKPNDQKDVGEPAFSPDGRYVYYSQDATAGETFQYNKDPHSGIYSINRLDRKEGRVEPLIGGPGGAVRPTPSPDGKYLAYVSRVGLKSVLFVHDLETGGQWKVYEDLERDMQETWAIHGVYPQMDWTPDSKQIVFWAKGKLRKVDVYSRKSDVIEFHVKSSRKVQKALRSPIEVAPEKFDTKMVRWAQVSPDGRKAVFQALGHLWIRDLKTKKSRRVTRQNEHFEFYPAWSRDGRSIVYVSYDDHELGSVRVVGAGGGSGRVVSPVAGVYVEPQFSPDGKTIVYRRTNGGGVLSERGSRETGLFWVPARGGKETRITHDGFSPQFGSDSERVYFTTSSRGPDKRWNRMLESVELDGSDRWQHLESHRAVEFRLSPDGNWLAFVENFEVFVAPFPPTGKKVTLGPKNEAMPQAKVAKGAGNFLHWSRDSKRVHWTLGPELFTRDLNNAFAFLEGAPEELPEPPADGVNIGFTAPTDIPKGTLALTGARIVTMKGDEVIEKGTILVENNRIKAIGAKVEVPAGTKVVDVAGKTIIPGLVDVHAHGAQGRHGLTPEQNWLHSAELSFGVTTVHDPSNDTFEIFAASEMQRAGNIVGPRIYSTGTILYGADGTFTAVVENLDDARRHLSRMKAVGAFSVKSYNQPRRNQRQMVVQAARELDMMVVPEGGSLFQHNMTMVVDGHTGVEHAIPVAAVYDDVKQLWGKTGVGYTPTLVVAYGGVWGENYWYQHTEVFENAKLKAFVPPGRVDARARRRMHVSEGDWNHFDAAKTAAELSKAGVLVNTGAHGQREGLAEHWELWMMVQGGLTPLEALRIATLNGAKYVGLDKDIGSLEVGKLADLVVIDGDPLKNIRDSEKVDMTMVNGRLYDANSMDEVGNHPRKRKPLAWEIDLAYQPSVPKRR